MSKSPNPIRVLVIEDNPDDRDLLLRQLQKAEIAEQVKFISDGIEALEFIQRHSTELAAHIMVIFLDLKLPGLGGLEVLKNIRTSPKLAAIPVIVMTSSTNPADMAACRALKVANYVEKPINFGSFSKAMADIFHRPTETSIPPQITFGTDR
jgi:two-component system response regulator